jgi:hypothetical protein
VSINHAITTINQGINQGSFPRISGGVPHPLHPPVAPSSLLPRRLAARTSQCTCPLAVSPSLARSPPLACRLLRDGLQLQDEDNDPLLHAPSLVATSRVCPPPHRLWSGEGMAGRKRKAEAVGVLEEAGQHRCGLEPDSGCHGWRR